MGSMEKQKYFEEALSDFVYDVGCGRAIRHLVNLGYTTTQIMTQLHYPVSERKVKKTVYQYLLETEILLEKLPVSHEQWITIDLSHKSEDWIYSYLLQKINQNGEQNSYISCPFGCMDIHAGTKLQNILSPLTAREREYILGIAWEPKTVFHKLDRRMLEIGIQLARHSSIFSFYFLKSKETAAFIPDSSVSV